MSILMFGQDSKEFRKLDLNYEENLQQIYYFLEEDYEDFLDSFTIISNFIAFKNETYMNWCIYLLMKELTMKQGFVVLVDNKYNAHVFVEDEEKFKSLFEEEEENVRIIYDQQELLYKKEDFITHLYVHTSYDSNLGLLRKLPTGHYISCDDIFDLKYFSVFKVEQIDEKMSRMICYREEESLILEPKQSKFIQPMIPPSIQIPI